MIEPQTQERSEDLTAGDRQRVLIEWNDTRVDGLRDNECVPAIFSHQARLTPDATALIQEGRRVTYAELESRSNQLAGFLRERGAGPDTLVGLCVERSVEMVVGLLGILKAGAGYVPLDPAYPPERLAYMLADANVPLLLTQTALGGKLPPFPGTAIEIDGQWPSIAQQPAEEQPSAVTPDHVAYVIYTSGSTGAPKGVVIPHRALLNHMLWMRDAFPLRPDDVVLQKTPLSFDASVWEVLAPLLSGATLVLAKPNGHKDPAYLCDVIRDHQVTTLQLVPSMLRLFLEQPAARACKSLRNVFSGGEALTTDLRDKVFDTLTADLHNLYGPTETCIQCVVYSCRRDDRTPGATVPIGRPIWNTQVYVLDDRREPVPIGTEGELFIAGAGLARGYLGRPDLTAERFVDNPFGPSGTRMYRSGDVVRYRSDGNLEFVGRADQQVKLRGYRIEPGEIESVLLSHPSVRQAVVVPWDDERGETHLVAYLVAKGSAPAADELREYLKGRLPEYMNVFAFVTLDALPMLPNSKVDRHGLPAPDISSGRDDSDSPRTPVQSVLAEIWQEVLGRDEVGIEDDFFDIGGTSLDLVRMFGRANERLCTRVDLAAVSEGATIAALAAAFDAAPRE